MFAEENILVGATFYHSTVSFDVVLLDKGTRYSSYERTHYDRNAFSI